MSISSLSLKQFIIFVVLLPGIQNFCILLNIQMNVQNILEAISWDGWVSNWQLYWSSRVISLHVRGIQ